jgi:hypothetical protein
MMAAKLFLVFVLSGSLAKAVEYHPSAAISSDATQAEDVLSQIDKGVLDFNPSIVAPVHWVIYPEDHPKIGVAAADRQKLIEPSKIEELEAETEFGKDPDLDAVLVQ